MNILLVTNAVPDAAGGGSPRRAAVLLESLKQLGDVTLVLPPLDGAPMPAAAGLTVIERDYALSDVRRWRHEGSRSRLKRFFHALRRPNRVDGRAYPAEAQRFRAALNEQFDLIFAYRLHSALWHESVFGHEEGHAIRIVDFDDIESRIFASQIEQVSGPWLWRAKLRRELRWLRKTERRVATEWDAVSLCSRLDADRFATMTGVEPWIVPNAYAFGPTTPEPPAPPCHLLFVGTFAYFPNVEGIMWFVDAVWPLVRAVLGNGVELALVGLHPTPAILALAAHDGITVAGDVPSVDPHYATANIVIAPLHAGSGTRIKLIEAAAKGRAIVTTTLGCEGLGFVDGVHAEIADDPADFAARIVALARDPARRAEMAETCYEFARREFSADTVADNLRDRIAALTRHR